MGDQSYASVLAAAAIAKIAEAALLECRKSDPNTFCANFCQSCRSANVSNPDATKTCLEVSERAKYSILAANSCQNRDSTSRSKEK